MPSHLHPRSAATSTLFAGTLAVCFAVVAVPHIWPCPRPRTAYMDAEVILDAEGRPIRRVKKVKRPPTDSQHIMEPSLTTTEVQSPNIQSKTVTISEKDKARQKTLADEALLIQQLQAEDMALRQEQARRECPVPKPKGVLGRLMGFNEEKTATENRRIR